MFKGKIFARSEVEYKLYFKQWKTDVEEKGYFNPEVYAESRKAASAKAEEGVKREEESVKDENEQEEDTEQPQKVQVVVELVDEEEPKTSPKLIKKSAQEVLPIKHAP